MGSNWPKAGFANEFQCEPAALPAAAAASRRADGPPVRRIRRYMVAAMVEALALGRLLGENPWLGGSAPAASAFAAAALDGFTRAALRGEARSRGSVQHAPCTGTVGLQGVLSGL